MLHPVGVQGRTAYNSTDYLDVVRDGFELDGVAPIYLIGRTAMELALNS
jgi:hypothetical protein